MSEFQQRFLDNLGPDILFSTFILAIASYGLYRLARAWKVSLLPLSVLLPSFVCIGLILYVPLSPLYIPSDGQYYQGWGNALAVSWSSGGPLEGYPQELWPGKGMWPLIIAGLSTVAGPVTLALIAINALILAVSVIALQKASFLLGGRAPRWSIVIVFLSSGPFLLWGPSLLREAIFWLGVAFGTLAIANAAQNKYRPALVYVFLSALILLGVRPDAGVVLAYGFCAVLVFLLGVVGPIRSWLRLVISLALLVGLALSFPTAFDFVRPNTTAGFISERTAGLSGPSVISSFAPDAPDAPHAHCTSAFAQASLGTAVLCMATVHMPYTLFGPFHWEYGPEPIWYLSGASTLHFLSMVGLSVYYLVTSKGRRWPLAGFLAVGVLSMVLFSSILSNYGILVRFRAATEIILIPLAISGLLSFLARLQTSRGKKSTSTLEESI